MTENNELLMLLLKENDSDKVINATPIKDVIHNRFVNEYKIVQSNTRLSNDLMSAFDAIRDSMKIDDYDEPLKKPIIEKLTFKDIYKNEIKKCKF